MLRLLHAYLHQAVSTTRGKYASHASCLVGPTAMRWCLSPTGIRSTNRGHTILFDNETGDLSLIFEEKRVEKDLTVALKRLPLRNPTSIQLLLNADESGIEHVFLSDDEIAKPPEEEEPVEFTSDEKLKGLSVVISMLNPADPVEHQYIISYVEFKTLSGVKISSSKH
ncbi:hypothetical protein CCR75_009573 [Bremia lactucae]|uniref:Uncharacterized protein n=1 Tax=Bremia lactucae TaxID=4779 RepID=A0A976FFB8_BRELC|nr:hypothetical protein CCR75_009573 [Bremia lactucae]